jgi:hypothetical protein
MRSLQRGCCFRRSTSNVGIGGEDLAQSVLKGAAGLDAPADVVYPVFRNVGFPQRVSLTDSEPGSRSGGSGNWRSSANLRWRSRAATGPMGSNAICSKNTTREAARPVKSTNAKIGALGADYHGWLQFCDLSSLSDSA